MEYTEGMLRVLRSRLIQYRSEKRVDGKRMSWEDIAKAILRAGADDEDDEEFDNDLEAGKVEDDENADSDGQAKKDDAPPPDPKKALGEALRRFSRGKQVLKPDRLNAIRFFLIEDDYLNDDDLVPDFVDTEDVRGLYRFFKFENQRLAVAHDTLPGRYVSVRREDGRQCEVAILSLERTDDGYIRARETVHRTSALPNTIDPVVLQAFLKRHSLSEIQHEGWLVENATRQVIVFLKDVFSGATDYYSVVSDGRLVQCRDRAEELVVLKHTYLGSASRITLGLRRSLYNENRNAGALVTESIGNHLWRFERQAEG